MSRCRASVDGIRNPPTQGSDDRRAFWALRNPPQQGAKLTSKNVRDRVQGLRYVRAAELRRNPANWRRHPKGQSEAMRGVLEEVGFAGALLAYEGAEGLTLIDGHLRANLAEDAELPVVVLDVSEDEARKLLATYDPLGAMAQPDQDALFELLESVSFESDAVNDMLEALANGETAKLAPLHETPEEASERGQCVCLNCGNRHKAAGNA